MRLAIAITALLLVGTVAQADRGPWHSRAAGIAALWVRFAQTEPTRAVELTRGSLRNDVLPSTACVEKRKKKLAYLTCLGDAFAKLQIDPQWIVMTADKLPTKEQKRWAKLFESPARFAVSTHPRGNIVVALGAPAKKRLPPPVLGVLIDEANAEK